MCSCQTIRDQKIKSAQRLCKENISSKKKEKGFFNLSQPMENPLNSKRVEIIIIISLSTILMIEVSSLSPLQCLHEDREECFPCEKLVMEFVKVAAIATSLGLGTWILADNIDTLHFCAQNAQVRPYLFSALLAGFCISGEAGLTGVILGLPRHKIAQIIVKSAVIASMVSLGISVSSELFLMSQGVPQKQAEILAWAAANCTLTLAGCVIPFQVPSPNERRALEINNFA